MGLAKLAPVNGFPFILNERARLALAGVGGLTLATAFPKLDLAGLAWVAPGLILFAARGSAAPFRTGYVAGAVFWLGSLHWLLFIPVNFYPIIGWLALCAYLALYTAAWCWLCVRIETQTGGQTWARRLGWALFCAAAWVALEMVRARLFSGFPWNTLGASQYRMLPLIQISSQTGVYGVSFLMVWFSVSLLLTAQALVRDPAHRILWLRELMLPLLVLALVAAQGVRAVAASRPPAGTRFLTVALVQPSIPQTMIWNDAESSVRFQEVLKLSELALATEPDLLIWPEAAVPKLPRYDRETREAITNLARRHQIWIILGADDAEPRGPDQADYFNSSFLVSPEGQMVANYRKRRLVIFGEYIPLVRWIPFLRWFTPIGDGFTAGDRVVPFVMPDLGVQTTTLICFEDTFPRLVREYAGPEMDFMVNITNDGWFSESAAQWQHAANAVFRAVENGLPLVRCANNGLTCWIDQAGGMHEVYFGESKDIYGPGFKTARIPLLPKEAMRRPTFYSRHGDWFGWGCVLLCAAGLLSLLIQKRIHSRST